MPIAMGCAPAAEVRARTSPSPTPTLSLSAAAASPTTPTVTRSVSPVPTDARGERPTAEDDRIVATIVAFARTRDARTFAALPLADTIGLELDDQIPLERPAAALARPEGWMLDVDQFNGHAGPFSALDLLARDVPTTTTIGPRPRCAAPATPTPAALADLRRISVQPKDVDTCLEWWAVDIYVSRSGRITTVALDLWSP